MNEIRNNFFAGNDQLGKDRRKPQTLKTYIVSYRLFLKFVLSRQDVRELTEVGDDDIRQVQSALGRLETWPKAYSDAFNLRKAEVCRRDEEERLSREDFQSFVNRERATEIAREYKNLRENPTRAVDINRFAELRDYLLLRVITASGQRCGAVGNLTVEEFDDGVQHNNDLYVTKTLRHKTAAGGQAKLMNESMVSKRIVVMGKQLNPELPGNLRGSRLRKGIITLQRSQETSTVSAESLAKQMSHSVSTAQKYYNIEEQARSDIRVASFLGSLVEGKEKEAEEKDCRVSVEVGEGEDEGLKDFPIEFVQDNQIQTVATGIDNAAPICFVQDEEVQSFVTGPTAEHPTFKLEKEEKRELIRVFQDLIKVGRVLAQFIYNQRKINNKILKRIRYENALDYLTEKSTKNITPREKCSSWVRTGEIHQVAASTSSCGTTKYWTDLQAEVLNDATRHLAFNSKTSDIYQAVLTDKPCQDHNLPDIYSCQQIRGKFRNIAKKRKSM